MKGSIFLLISQLILIISLPLITIRFSSHFQDTGQSIQGEGDYNRDLDESNQFSPLKAYKFPLFSSVPY